jgi:hypothetical protein
MNPTKETGSTAGAATVSPGGYSDAYGPNVANILTGATRVVRGRIPAAVRKELSAAVKDGVLGRLKRDGLKPEVFFHPDHKNGAIERQNREAQYSVECIAKVVAHGAERAEYDFAAIAKATGQ